MAAGLTTTNPVASSIPIESSNLAAASSLSELAHSVKEKGHWIFGESESKRRVISIEKKDGSYGFTLQSYGVRYKHGNRDNRETDYITYVNAVEREGAAFGAGLREGDVILSLNGQNMARVEHSALVSFIRNCPTCLRMVVISDERARKVEAHMRYVHLQKKLGDKMAELEQLNKAEKEILLGTFEPHGQELGMTETCLTDITSCCFCPSKTTKGTAPFMMGNENKERSRSMSSSHSREKDLYYDCYRKSQSTKELASATTGTDPSSSSVVGSVMGIQSAKKAQSGGELSVPLSSSAGVSGHCKGHHLSPSPSPGIKEGGRSTSASPKPKSWDNLVTTKSFGGVCGFGYGYYPPASSSSSASGGHNHFSHPHHHNHHTHFNNHAHSGYYYCGGNVNKQGSLPAPSSRRSSSGTAGDEIPNSSRPFTNYTTYKMVGTTRVVARVTMGNITGAQGPCTRTLPSTRSTRQTPTEETLSNYSASSSGKMEKTLSDSSLSDANNKDFSKSYFNSKRDGGRYSSRHSSDDDYPEPNKSDNDIYV